MSNKKVINATFQSALGEKQIASKLDNEVGPRVIGFINERVQSGEFIGGSLANKGYSENPLPVFYFGKSRYNSTNKSIAVNPERVASVVFSDEDVFWRTVEGSSMAFLEGGYKAFREAIGRDTDKVDLTLSGAMLRGITHEVSIRNSVELTVGVTNEARDYAKFVDAQREFLGLTRQERWQIARMLEE